MSVIVLDGIDYEQVFIPSSFMSSCQRGVIVFDMENVYSLL